MSCKAVWNVLGLQPRLRGTTMFSPSASEPIRPRTLYYFLLGKVAVSIFLPYICLLLIFLDAKIEDIQQAITKLMNIFI